MRCTVCVSFGRRHNAPQSNDKRETRGQGRTKRRRQSAADTSRKVRHERLAWGKHAQRAHGWAAPGGTWAHGITWLAHVIHVIDSLAVRYAEHVLCPMQASIPHDRADAAAGPAGHAAAVAPAVAAGPSQQRADSHAAELQRMRDLLRAKDSTIQELIRTNATLTQEQASVETMVADLLQEHHAAQEALLQRDATIQRLTQERDSAAARVEQLTREGDMLRVNHEQLVREKAQWEVRARRAELALHQAQGDAMAKELAALERPK